MVGLVQRLENQLYTASWQIPTYGLLGGVMGALYAQYAKLPLEKAVIAYAIWGVAEVVFRNLAMLWTDDSKKRAMLDCGAHCMICIAGIVKLTQMKLMGHKIAMTFAILNAIGARLTLKEHGIIKS